MGFVVDAEKRLVTVDHSHNNFCITTPQGNPTKITLGTLKVTSIFARTKGKRDISAPGDNSPMLYALKGLHNLQTRRRDIGMLCASFREILSTYVDGSFQWDWIVSLPSSSPVCSSFADRVFKHTQQGICYHNALVKITAVEVLHSVDALKIKAADKTVIKTDIFRFISNYGEETPFQIKSIRRVKLRKYLNPLTWGHVPATSPPRGILLIDDMVTSGTSLVNAEAILKHRYPLARIEALTLFGSSK
ncbi:phosphoribosyltransferase [Salmonella enterica]|nr:phosphoribosyltransferase [Salmonella enterica]